MKHINNVSLGKVFLAGFWFIAISGALIFVGIKLRNWGSVIAAPEQSDFYSYYSAALISQNSPELLYRSDEWHDVLGLNRNPLPFLYSPTTAIIIRSISRLPFDVARKLWFWASAISIIATVVLLSWKMPSKNIRMMGALLLIFSPSTLDTLHLGQINGFLALLVSLSWVGFDSRRPIVGFMSGALLGAACCIKPTPVGIIFLAVIHKRMAYTMGFVSGVIVFLLFGMAALPIEVTRHYFEVMAKMSGELAPPGLTMFWNQSISAFWHKLLGANSDWPNVLIPFSIGAVLLVASLGLLHNLSHRFHMRNIDAAIVFLSVLLCAPITWWHYLLIVAPVYFGVSEAYFKYSNTSLGRMALPFGFSLIVIQRASERLVSATSTILFSSLMMFGLLIWFLMLVPLAFSSKQAE